MGVLKHVGPWAAAAGGPQLTNKPIIAPARRDPDSSHTRIDRRAFGVSLMSAGVMVPRSVRGATGDYDTERIRLESDGRQIRTVAFRPRNALLRGGVVFLHGAGGLERGQLAFAERFATRGLLMLIPTYLDAAADDGVRGPPVMTAWRRCASDAVEALIDQGVDPAKTILIGVSLGAYIAVDSALGSSRAGSAVGILGGWDVYPPRPPRRRIPIMLIRSENDTHVRPSSTERWRRFLAERNVPVVSRTIVNATHFLTPDNWNNADNYVMDFIGERLD